MSENDTFKGKYVEINIAVNGLRHQLIHAISARHLGIQQEIEEQVDLALRNWDVNTTVTCILAEIAREEVKKHLQWAIRRAFDVPEVKEAVAQAVAAKIREEL